MSYSYSIFLWCFDICVVWLFDPRRVFFCRRVLYCSNPESCLMTLKVKISFLPYLCFYWSCVFAIASSCFKRLSQNLWFVIVFCFHVGRKLWHLQVKAKGEWKSSWESEQLQWKCHLVSPADRHSKAEHVFFGGGSELQYFLEASYSTQMAKWCESSTNQHKLQIHSLQWLPGLKVPSLFSPQTCDWGRLSAYFLTVLAVSVWIVSSYTWNCHIKKWIWIVHTSSS